MHTKSNSLVMVMVVIVCSGCYGNDCCGNGCYAHYMYHGQVAKWNTRTTQLIERYNQVDPDEYKQLMEERETRKQEMIELKTQIESLRYVCVRVYSM